MTYEEKESDFTSDDELDTTCLREMLVREDLLDGYVAYQQGKLLSAESADILIRQTKGWS